MNFLDWASLMVFLGTLVGAQAAPDFNLETDRTTLAQAEHVAVPQAQVSIGGDPVMRFADTGVNTAYERAIEAKENLRKVIEHHDLPAKYVGLGLRLGGDNDLVTLNYLDVRITSVTKADAKANQAGSPRELAERWKADLDREIHRLPAPVPDAWIAASGKPTPSLLVSDPTLAASVAECLSYRPGQSVTVKAEGGTVVLEGQVADEKERGRLVRLVRQVPGVVDVVDRTAISR
ncbi:MAG: hypothetical protein JWM80_1898 [Cyanobacteria bacterium RYN_339]|nr:hypothetical protein [Cyanobacteria bacterium RYN_339]